MQTYHLQNRPNRELLDESELTAILKNGKFAVISMCRNNEPYIVTLSNGYDKERKSLYFHCAQEGLKLDFIIANRQVCAAVIEDGGYIIGECGHHYKSVIFWGDMHIVTDVEEKKRGMDILLHQLEEDDSVIRAENP